MAWSRSSIRSNHPQAGQLTDPDLRELLGLLAQRNPGLVIISSRQALTDFTCGAASTTRSTTSKSCPSSAPSPCCGRCRSSAPTRNSSKPPIDYACHALSLIVLGRFLFVKGGDIRLRSQIPLERANENRNQRITRNAWHVLEAYEQWLASPEAMPPMSRPCASPACSTAPPVPTASPPCAPPRPSPASPTSSCRWSDDAWNALLHRLHEAHLIPAPLPAVEEGSFAPRPEAREVTVDVHPLIREYFAKQLREPSRPEASKPPTPGCSITCAPAPSHRPDTLAGLQPLYQAVTHGCLAGRQQEAV
jgi:hypothetical protein